MTTIAGLDHHTLCTPVGWDAPLLVSTFVPVDFSRPQLVRSQAQSASDALEQLRQLAGTGKTATDERRTVVAAELRY